jgi:hypothetical protein
MAVFIFYLCLELLQIVPQDSVGSALWVLCQTVYWFWQFCRAVPILFHFLNDASSMNSIFLGVSKCFAVCFTYRVYVSVKCASQTPAKGKLWLLAPFDDTGYLASQYVTRSIFQKWYSGDHLYPNIFVDFRFLIVLGNNKKISNIISFVIMCTTDSLVWKVASSNQVLL